MGRPKGSIISPEERRRRGNLTMVLRSTFHELVIRDWFLMILSGKNPVITEDKRFTEQGGYKVTEDPIDRSTPSHERRDAAMKELMNRIYGLPAAHVQIEQEVDRLSGLNVIASTELTALSPAVLGTLLQVLRGQLPGTPTLPVLDVTSTET